MRCPFLVVHGEDDEQVPLADAQALYDACGSKDKTLRVFTAEEGGAQHCQRDYLTLGCADDVELVRGQAAAGVIRIDSSAASSVCSLSPFGERVGVRGFEAYRETLTPHPALATIRSAGGDLPLALNARLGA